MSVNLLLIKQLDPIFFGKDLADVLADILLGG